MDFSVQIAGTADLDQLHALMKRSIDALQQDFLSPEQVAASHEVMGLDSQLVEDGTYFMIFHKGTLVGSGGWSFRETLFGGDHTRGRCPAKLDPACDAGRIRAMYTDPAWARRGVGSLIMRQCETALRQYGFTRATLVATLSGEPLYRHWGYEAEEYFEANTTIGVSVPLIRMQKSL